MTLRTADDISPDAAVRLDDVGVRYRIVLDAGLSLKEWAVRRRKRRVVEYEALHGIDLEIRRGETIGIIGRNGAGKTTLLRLIARLLPPATGRIRIRGKVAPLIDLFGSLHHELTGRENALLTGALLGLSRQQMRERIESIAAFADIGEFFDAPLRTYSAGMIVRVSFATAISVDADTLLIDEALGVGDTAFQQKSSARIDTLRRHGATCIVVSHDVQRLATTCDRLVWLEAGRIVDVGYAPRVADRYLASVTGPVR